jgi:hypothetical protein
LLPSRAHERGM